MTINSVASIDSLRAPSSLKAPPATRGAERRSPRLDIAVERAHGEFADERRAFAEALGFAEKFLDAKGDQISRFGIVNQDSQRFEVLFAEGIQKFGGPLTIAGLAACGGFNQAIGDAAHGRHDYDQRAYARGFGDNFSDACDARSVAHRCAAKFHDLQM